MYEPQSLQALLTNSSSTMHAHAHERRRQSNDAIISICNSDSSRDDNDSGDIGDDNDLFCDRGRPRSSARSRNMLSTKRA